MHLTEIPMSVVEMHAQEMKYVFKARYGTEPTNQPVKEATREEIDSFVREVLGLDKERRRK